VLPQDVPEKVDDLLVDESTSTTATDSFVPKCRFRYREVGRWINSLCYLRVAYQYGYGTSYRYCCIQNKWDSFTLGDLNVRSSPQNLKAGGLKDLEMHEVYHQQREAELRDKKVVKHIKAGEIGKALKHLVETSKPAVVDAEALELLKALYPPAAVVEMEQSIAAEEEEAVQVDATEVDEVVSVNEVFYFLQRSPRVVAPGLDGFRFNHFRQMVSRSADNPTKHKVLQLFITWLWPKQKFFRLRKSLEV